MLFHYRKYWFYSWSYMCRKYWDHKKIACKVITCVSIDEITQFLLLLLGCINNKAETFLNYFGQSTLWEITTKKKLLQWCLYDLTSSDWFICTKIENWERPYNDAFTGVLVLQPQLLEKLKGYLRVISKAQFFTFKTFANQWHKSNTVDCF